MLTVIATVIITLPSSLTVASLSREIPAGGTLSITIDTIACDGTDKQIAKLEHVALTLSFQHRRRGDVSVDLFSPSGTRNEMLSTRRYDDSKNGLHDWTFMTVHCWGENPKGIWVMNVTDSILSLNKGVDVNGYVQHDTSKQEADVEDLEEEVCLSFFLLWGTTVMMELQTQTSETFSKHPDFQFWS